MKKKSKDKSAAIVDVGSAPEIYVDGFQGAMVRNNILKINFFAEVFDPEKEEIIRKCVFVLAASSDTVVQIHEVLGTIIADVEKSVAIMKADGEKTDA